MEHWLQKNQGKKQLELGDALEYLSMVRQDYDHKKNINPDQIRAESDNFKKLHFMLVRAPKGVPIKWVFAHNSEDYMIGPLEVNTPLKRDYLLSALTPLISFLDKLENQVRTNEERLESIITLEVLPNDAFGGERWYLGQGIVVAENDRGYETLSVRRCHHHKGIHLVSNEDRYSSIDDAISSVAGPNYLGTIAVAKGAKLNNKVHDILERKYNKGLKA